MSDQIPGHYRIQFADTIALLLQQRGSKLAKTVMSGAYKGKAASPVDQFGATAAKKRTGRYAPKTPANTPTDRRWVYPSPYDWMDLIDSFDKLQTILDPQSAYVQNATNALGRSKDDEIIAAIFGVAKTGEQGGVSVNFLSGNQLSVDIGGTASGLNVAKLRAGKKLLMAAEVDLDADEIWCPVTASQHDNLLNEIQVISSDFNGGDKPVLKDGKVDRFLGINFVHCERLPVNGSGYRRVPLYAKSGLHLGMWEDIKTDITLRTDLEGDPIQVSATGAFGATRTEEKKVVELPCAES
jgi:hypothetical protein